MCADVETVRLHRLRPADPARLGRHAILGRLGTGGMGVVYLGDGPLGLVAIKLVREELADDPQFRLRFQREVQACFRVSGSCTARLLDFDLEADPPWLVTEFFDAPDLGRRVLEDGPLPAAAQVALAAGLAEALVSIHEAGLIHRDLKPSNVLCTDTGPKVIDFGIAAARDSTPLTATGQLVGTPGWLAPEQVTAGEVTAASDIFSWAGLVAFAASARPPYGEGPSDAIIYRIVAEEPRVDYELIAPALRDLVREALAREPGARPSALRLRDELLRRALDDPTAPTSELLTRVLQLGWTVPARRGDTPRLPPGERVTVPVAPTPGPPGPSAPPASPGAPAPADPPRRPRRRRRVIVAAAATVVLLAGAVAAAVLLRSDGGSGTGSGTGSFTAAGPWRIRIVDNISGQDDGCTVALTNLRTGQNVRLPDSVYGEKVLQIAETGEFRWRVNDSECEITPLAGSGRTRLPFTLVYGSDSAAFAPPTRVGLEVTDFNGSPPCELRLFDPADGTLIDAVEATEENGSVQLDSGGRAAVYVGEAACTVRVSVA
jgi:hypothetical protein